MLQLHKNLLIKEYSGYTALKKKKWSSLQSFFWFQVQSNSDEPIYKSGNYPYQNFGTSLK